MTTRGAKHGKLFVIFLKLVSRVCAMWRKWVVLLQYSILSGSWNTGFWTWDTHFG